MAYSNIILIVLALTPDLYIKSSAPAGSWPAHLGSGLIHFRAFLSYGDTSDGTIEDVTPIVNFEPPVKNAA